MARKKALSDAQIESLIGLAETRSKLKVEAAALNRAFFEKRRAANKLSDAALAEHFGCSPAAIHRTLRTARSYDRLTKRGSEVVVRVEVRGHPSD